MLKRGCFCRLLRAHTGPKLHPADTRNWVWFCSRLVIKLARIYNKIQDSSRKILISTIYTQGCAGDIGARCKKKRIRNKKNFIDSDSSEPMAGTKFESKILPYFGHFQIQHSTKSPNLFVQTSPKARIPSLCGARYCRKLDKQKYFYRPENLNNPLRNKIFIAFLTKLWYSKIDKKLVCLIY